MPQFSPRRVVRAFCAASAMLLLGSGAPLKAQDQFPNRPVHLITQFGSGGATDLAARAIAEAMGPGLGVTVIVEGRPGAGGQIAVNTVRNAPPDGYNMLFGGQTSLVNLPIIDPASAGNPLADFKIVTFGTDYDLILVTGAGSGIKSVKELVERLRSRRAESTFGALGLGVPVEMSSLYFLQKAGVEATAVPYKGPVDAYPDLIEGRLTFQSDTVTGPIGLIREKRLIPLAVFSKTRTSQIPDLPTFAEAGFPEVLDVNWRSWNAVLVRSQTPQAIIDKLNEAARKGMAGAKFKERIDQLGHGVVGLYTAREAQANLDALVTQWKSVILKMGIKPPTR